MIGAGIEEHGDEEWHPAVFEDLADRARNLWIHGHSFPSPER